MLYPLSYGRPPPGLAERLDENSGPDRRCRIQNGWLDRGVTGPTRLVTAGAALALLAGCSSGSGTDGAAPEPSPTSLTELERPHFKGARDLTVQTGRIIYSEETCDPAPGDDRVCSPDGSRTYLAFGEPATVSLAEVRMDPDDGNTSWTTTIRFDPDDRRVVSDAFTLATATGAVVLLLGEDQEVLLPSPVTEYDGRRIVLENLTKPEAWELVERFVVPAELPAE